MHCGNYKTASCCDPGTAKRAYNWAYEDDGCGVVGGQCLRMTIDVACYVNCAPSLPVNIDADIYLKPLICDSYARSIYAACRSYAWCGTTQFDASTCQFLQKKDYGRRVSGVEVVNAWDTCTAVADITYLDFARKILKVDVAPEGPINGTKVLCVDPITQPAVNAASSHFASHTHLLISISSLVTFVYCAIRHLL